MCCPATGSGQHISVSANAGSHNDVSQRESISHLALSRPPCKQYRVEATSDHELARIRMEKHTVLIKMWRTPVLCLAGVAHSRLSEECGPHAVAPDLWTVPCRHHCPGLVSRLTVGCCCVQRPVCQVKRTPSTVALASSGLHEQPASCAVYSFLLLLLLNMMFLAVDTLHSPSGVSRHSLKTALSN